MTGLLPPPPLLTTFLAASLVLAVTPGPGVVYIVIRSMSQGRLAGLASVAGVAAGNFGNAILASLGLAAVFAVSALAFTIVKWLGAAYLVWLGLAALRSARTDAARPAPARHSLPRIWRDAFLVALLNPKTTLFFAAFLPQFTSPGSPRAVQCLLLGAIFVAIAMISDTIYALAAGAASGMLRNARGLQTLARYLAGSALIGLGVLAAATGARPAR
jgi:threonine/homoserine/homoserine lactone efflux protein